MENPPTILKVKNRKFILDKVYEKNRYALYSNMEYGYKECFHFHDLDLIESIGYISHAWKKGMINL
jgi:hypothetical protein